MREKKLEGVWGNKENSWVLQRVLPFSNPTIIVSYFIDFILLKTSILPFLSAPFTGEWTTFVSWGAWAEVTDMELPFYDNVE